MVVHTENFRSDGTRRSTQFHVGKLCPSGDASRCALVRHVTEPLNLRRRSHIQQGRTIRIENVSAVAPYFLLETSDRMMPLLPAFWLGGMVMALEVMSVGATLVYPPSPDPDIVLDTIQRFNVNRVCLKRIV